MNPVASRPDFTGVWELNLEMSRMLGSVPRAMLVRIDHQDPLLVQYVLVNGGDGVERRQTFRCEAGAETTNLISGLDCRTRARWEGLELLIESWMKTPARDLHFVDYWSLSPDGSRLTMEHRDDDLAGQVAVLGRAPRARFPG